MCLSAVYWTHIKKVVYGLDRQPGLEKYFVTKEDLSQKMIDDLMLRQFEIKQIPLHDEYGDIFE